MGILEIFAQNNIKRSAVTICYDIIIKFGLIETKIYFDDRCVYTDGKDFKHQIQYIIMDKFTAIEVCINDKLIDLAHCNIAICTLVEMKMKHYAEEFSAVTKKEQHENPNN